MSKANKIRAKILSGSSDANVDFNDLCWILTHYGFDARIKGSHHIFTREGVEEILNLQPKGAKAKAYQIKQVREVFVKYKIGGDDE